MRTTQLNEMGVRPCVSVAPAHDKEKTGHSHHPLGKPGDTHFWDTGTGNQGTPTFSKILNTHARFGFLHGKALERVLSPCCLYTLVGSKRCSSSLFLLTIGKIGSIMVSAWQTRLGIRCGMPSQLWMESEKQCLPSQTRKEATSTCLSLDNGTVDAL